MSQLGFDLKIESELQATTEDVVKTSEIEGETLDPAVVRSSVARRLGMSAGGVSVVDRTADGVVDMVLDATQHHDRTLSPERLRGWHAALFPTGYSGVRKITVADWRADRDGPMRVVSGAMGRERVHFEAPPAERVATEMDRLRPWSPQRTRRLKPSTGSGPRKRSATSPLRIASASSAMTGPIASSYRSSTSSVCATEQ